MGEKGRGHVGLEEEVFFWEWEAHEHIYMRRRKSEDSLEYSRTRLGRDGSRGLEKMRDSFRSTKRTTHSLRQRKEMQREPNVDLVDVLKVERVNSDGVYFLG